MVHCEVMLSSIRAVFTSPQVLAVTEMPLQCVTVTGSCCSYQQGSARLSLHAASKQLV